MRVGIYNRWLATLGGGEKHMLAIAEHLSRDHSVNVITHKPVAKESAAARLNLDLARVEFSAIPDRPPAQITPLTAEFDLFICASFLDLFPTRAPHSAMLVFFPTPLGAEPALRFRRRVGLAIKRALMVPTFADGVLSTDLINGALVRQTTAQVSIQLPSAGRDYAISFDLAARVPSARRAIITLDGRVADTVDLVGGETWTRSRVNVPASPRSARILTICAEMEYDRRAHTPAQMTLAHFKIEHPRYRLYRIIFERWFKNWGLKLYRIPSHVSPFLTSIQTYDALWANSKFTQSWIKRYWNLPSQILYPPIDVENFPPARKQNRILSVGRFFVGSHNKKHREMVATFKRLVERGLTDWELHLAGGTAPGADNQNYLRAIESEACGYPIFIHTDIAHSALSELYASSAIYWHAGGYGENEMREPIKFEHFGITTVEAMAAGCVPVVINKGGQIEVVRHGVTGFLWNTLDELGARTMQLVRDAALREQLTTAAIRESSRYDKAHFHSQLQLLLQSMRVS